MKIYHSFPTDLPRTLLTIGTFDGVHLGHQALIQTCKTLSPHVTLLTFSNHPLEVLKPNTPPPRVLTPIQEKLALLEHYGVTVAIVLPFTPALRDTSFQDLLRHFSLSHLVLGQGDVFGKNREGNEENVTRYAKTHNFEAHYIPKLEYQGAPISSTRIRGLLNEATHMLGHPKVIA